MLHLPDQRVLAIWGCFLMLTTTACMGQDRTKPAESSATVQWNLVFIGPDQAVPISVTVRADEGPLARRKKLAAMLLLRFWRILLMVDSP